MRLIILIFFIVSVNLVLRYFFSIIRLPNQMVDNCYVYQVDVKKMLNLLQQKQAEDASKKFYSLEAFKYKIQALDKMSSCPLLLSSNWISDNFNTKLKVLRMNFFI